jgi:hypothetical protein
MVEHKANIIMNLIVATLTLGSRPRQRACKRASQMKDPRDTSYTLKSEGECEKMNPHTPKGLSNLQGTLVRVKTHWFEKLFISLESY